MFNLENKEKEFISKLNGCEQHVNMFTTEVEDLRNNNKLLETTRFKNEKLIAE